MGMDELRFIFQTDKKTKFQFFFQLVLSSSIYQPEGFIFPTEIVRYLTRNIYEIFHREKSLLSSLKLK